MFDRIWNFLAGREPVATVAVLRSLLIVAVVFGAGLTPEQIAAVLTAAELGLTWLLRRGVSPTPKADK